MLVGVLIVQIGYHLMSYLNGCPRVVPHILNAFGVKTARPPVVRRALQMPNHSNNAQILQTLGARQCHTRIKLQNSSLIPSSLFRPTSFRLRHLLVCIRTSLSSPPLPLAMIMGMIVSGPVVVVVIVIMSRSTSGRSRSPVISTIAIAVTARRALVAGLVDRLWGVVDAADCSSVSIQVYIYNFRNQDTRTPK